MWKKKVGKWLNREHWRSHEFRGRRLHDTVFNEKQKTFNAVLAVHLHNNSVFENANF